MLREKFFVHALKLFSNPLDLLPRGGALLIIHLHCLRTGEPPMGAVHNRGDHLQIADQFGGCSGRGFLLGLPLRFEEQRRIIQDAFADRGRSLAPGGIQLTGFACIAVMLGENGRHALAGLQALPCCGHEELHRHLRRDLSLAHPLLDGLRQKLH